MYDLRTPAEFLPTPPTYFPLKKYLQQPRVVCNFLPLLSVNYTQHCMPDDSQFTGTGQDLVDVASPPLVRKALLAASFYCPPLSPLVRLSS